MTNVTIDKETLEHLIQAASNWAEELIEHIIPAEEENADAHGWEDELNGYEADAERTGHAVYAARQAIITQTWED